MKDCKYAGIEFYAPDTKKIERKCTHKSKIRYIQNILSSIQLVSYGRCDNNAEYCRKNKNGV